MSELVYEVRTRCATDAIRERYLAWLNDGHLRAVVDAGALDGEVRVMPDGAIVSRYRFASDAAFAAYEAGPAAALRQEGRALFSEGVVMERATSHRLAHTARSPLEVVPVPCLSDNYAYLLIDRDAGEAVVIDPSEASPVRAALVEHGVKLTAIWCTHHHFDHVGGNDELKGTLPVLGSAHDAAEGRIPGQTRALADGDEVHFGARSFTVMAIPGHTLGAIAFVGDGKAFTGDTLFSGGCGRVFEGTMPMMHASLSRLGALDGATLVYSGHEYTQRNLEFALVVEPDSAAVRARLAAVESLRRRGVPTVGSRIDEERATNPFLRAEAPEVAAFARRRGAAGSVADVFARVREAKDSF